MSKPEDIPQGAWGEAENTLDHMLCCEGYESARDDAIAIIARAIMAAKAEEREAILGLAEAERIAWSSGEYFGGFNDACNTIAAAIRKRGEG